MPINPMPLIHDALTDAYLRCRDGRKSGLLKVEIDLLETLI